MSTFLERIKVLCKQKGVTVKQAEIDNGLGTGYFRTTSKQGSIPRSDRLDRIAEYFNVSREYLLGEVETISDSSQYKGFQTTKKAPDPKTEGINRALHAHFFSPVEVIIQKDSFLSLINTVNITCPVVSKKSPAGGQGIKTTNP